MKNITRFTQLLKELKLKSSDFFFVDKKEKDQFDHFYDYLLEGKFETDKEAAFQLFGSSQNHSTYRNFKSKYKEKLINSLLFYKTSRQQSDLELAYIYCSKYLVAAKLCFHLGNRNIGTELSIKVLKKAIKFELAEFASASAKLLRREIGIMKGNSEKFNYYNEIYHFYTEQFIVENLAEEYYYLLILPYSNAKTIHSSTYQVGKRYYEKLAPHLQKYNSPFLHLTVHLINIITHLSINDFEKAKAICANNISFFEQKPYTYNMPIRVLLLNHLICCIHLKNYKEGKAIVLKAEKYIIEGTFPWFRHQELHLALAFHAAFYELAPNIVYTVLRHSRFKSLKASLQERWRINEAYIHLLIQLGKITTPIPNKKRFNLGKFLNQVSIYEKDKKGLKVCLVIIQLLFRILRKEEDQLNKQVDSTKKYCSRYLNSTAGLRSKYFINMLLQVPKANFHPVASERKAKRYYDKLKAHPLKLSNQAQEIEIIPFEDLWELILERLQSIR